MTSTPSSDLAAARDQFHRLSPTGKVDLTLAFEVIFYFVGPPSAHWPGIQAFHDAVVPLIRDRVRHYIVDGRAKGRKVDAEAFELIPAWAGKTVADRHIYGLTLHGGEQPEDASDIAFEFYADGADPGYVRLLLPCEAGMDERAAELTRRLAALWPWWAGTAGFCAPMRRGYSSSSPASAVAALGKRYLGVDFGHPHMFATYFEHGLKTVNWFSLVHEDLWRQHAPSSAPDSDSELEVLRLDKGVLVRAGGAPTLGDVNRQQPLDAYRAADALLRPVRITSDTLDGYDELGGEDNTAAWIERLAQ